MTRLIERKLELQINVGSFCCRRKDEGNTEVEVDARVIIDVFILLMVRFFGIFYIYIEVEVILAPFFLGGDGCVDQKE